MPAAAAVSTPIDVPAALEKVDRAKARLATLFSDSHEAELDVELSELESFT
jgi:hypothetical protein